MRSFFVKTSGSIIFSIALFLVGVQPTFAAGVCDNTTSFTFQASQGIKGLICFASNFLSKLIIPFMVSLALLMFIYGVLVYVMNASSDDKRKEGSKFMLYGIIGLFVMVSVWGLVNILGSTFNLTNTMPQLPQ
jgi:fumarate reductase subunit D